MKHHSALCKINACIFFFTLCIAAKTYTINGDRLSITLSDANGSLESISERNPDRQLVASSFDRYVFQTAPDKEISANEKDDKVVARQGSKFTCRNNSIPAVIIEKEYFLKDNVVTKKVSFRAEENVSGFLKYSTATNPVPAFYKDGYLNRPTRHVTGKALPYIKTSELKEEQRIFDINPKADHHLVIFTSPLYGKGIAQYRFKVDDYFVHPLTGYAYEPGLFYGPSGWRMAVAGKWLSGSDILSCETRWHVFSGNHLDFHQAYMDLPEFKEMSNSPMPSWMQDVKQTVIWSYGKQSTRMIKKICNYADGIDDGYLLVLIGNVFYNTRNYSSDLIPSPTGIPLASEKLKSIIDELHKNPRIKVGAMTWQWGFGPRDPVFYTHPEWTVHDGNGNPVFAATGWEEEKSYQQLLTPEARDFILKQYDKMITKYNFDCIYLDGGQGGITSFDWRTKKSAQDYDWALLYKGMRDSIRKNNGGTFFNGLPGLYSVYSDFGFYEGVGIFERAHWQALSDRLLLGKLYQNKSSKRPLPIYWQENVRELYANYCYLFGLAAGTFDAAGEGRAPTRWPVISALHEIKESILLPHAVITPCWWKEKVSAEAYALKIEGGILLSVMNHSKTASNIKITVDITDLGFTSGKDIHRWLFVPETVADIEKKCTATEAAISKIFNQNGGMPLRAVNAAFLDNVIYPDNKLLSQTVSAGPDQTVLILLTQADRLAYTRNGIPSHFLLPAGNDKAAHEKTVKSSEALPEFIEKSRRQELPLGSILPLVSSGPSSPDKANYTAQRIDKCINGVNIKRKILIDCEHNTQNSAELDLETLTLKSSMGDEKVNGFASSAIESDNLQNVKLIVSIDPLIPGKNPDSFCGIVVDYQNKNGAYVKRVFFKLQAGQSPSARPWHGYFKSKASKIPPETIDLSGKIKEGDNNIDINLYKYAPADWNGNAIFAAAVDRCPIETILNVRIAANINASADIQKQSKEESPKAEVAPGTKFQGDALIYKLGNGAKLVNNELYMPVKSTLDARGLAITTMKIECPPGRRLEMLIDYNKSDGSWTSVKYTFPENSGTEDEVNFDFNQYAPADWNKHLKIQVNGEAGSVLIKYNSQFQVF